MPCGYCHRKPLVFVGPLARPVGLSAKGSCARFQLRTVLSSTLPRVLPDFPVMTHVASYGAGAVRYGAMTKTVRDVLGDPLSWPIFRGGGTRMPLLRGATIVAVREAEPDEIRLVIDARGKVLHSSFVIDDRDVRQRLLEILQPGLFLEECLNHAL